MLPGAGFFTFYGYLEHKDAYLVEGEEVGIGSDDEPVLSNAKISKKLNKSNIFDIKAYMSEMAEKQEEGKAKFSMKDDKGRELTQEQAQYFKDSKVKKGKNTLLTVYHGGTVKDVFDIKSGTAWNQYGDGAYFSDSEYYADEYSSAKEGETKEYYLNITNPFDLTSTLPESESRDRLESILEKDTISQTGGYDKYSTMTLITS